MKILILMLLFINPVFADTVEFTITGDACACSVVPDIPEPPPEPTGGESILIVYYDRQLDENGNGVHDTLEVVSRYREVRSVPAENVLAIPGPVYSDNTFQQQYDALYQPVKDKLEALGKEEIIYIVLVDIPIKLKSPIPGQTYAATQALISRIDVLERAPKHYPSTNELYGADRPTPYVHPETGPVYLVSSLDRIRALKQIDDAIFAETNEVPGKYIFDSKFQASNNEIEQSIYSAYETAKQQGREALWHCDRDILGKEETDTWCNGDPIVTPVPTLFYTGWYGFYEDVFEFVPGSVYAQVISYWRNPHQIALEHGATFVSGPVMEPYYSGVCQPKKFTELRLAGYSWGEAVLYSVPKKMWANHASGDPVARWK